MSVTYIPFSDTSITVTESAKQLEKESGKEQQSELSALPVIEEDAEKEEFEQPIEFGEFVENSPKIFSIKNILEPLTIESLNNVIYELGVVNLCWPEIKEPVFETRTCFPESYYTNSPKERLLLAYTENFRRQYHFYYKKNKCYRKSLLLQAQNECGLQKMVCTTIRATKLCFTGTNTWQGLASLVADYFVYEPLTKPMLHPERIISPYTALIRRAGNPFEIAHVLVSWLIGATYDAYVVVGCAKRDVCMNIRYRTVCPDIPDEREVIEEEKEPEEEPRYKLVPLPDLTSKYVKMMEERARKKIQDEIDRKELERQLKIKELELPPEDPIDGWRTHAWVLVMPGPMGIEEPFFIEPAEGNAYPLNCPNYQQIDSIYNNENYYVNLQTIRILDEDEWAEEDFLESELKKEKVKDERAKALEEKAKGGFDKRQETKKKMKEKKQKKEGHEGDEHKKKDDHEGDEHKKKDDHDGDEHKKEKSSHDVAKEEGKKDKEKGKEKDAKGKKEKKKKEKVEEEVEEEEEQKIVWSNLSHFSYDLSDLTCWEHLLPGEPNQRRQLVGIDTNDKRTAVDTEKHLDMPESWVEKLDITAADYMQRYPGCHKKIHYKRVLVEKFSRYSQRDGIVTRIQTFQDYALTKPIMTWEYYMNREDLMHTVRIDYEKQEILREFHTGRSDHLLKHYCAMDAPPTSIEAHRTMEFKWLSRLDHLEKIVCTPLTLEEIFRNREDLLENRHIVYQEGTKAEPKRQLLTVTETYARNHNIPAVKDIWKRIFHIQSNKIELLYHYAYNFITNDTRHFEKPNLAETGGKILFYPDKTSGYTADPCGLPRRDIDVYYALCENMQWEYVTTKHIRDYETDIISNLVIRYKELLEPTLYVSLFNTERNEEAQQAFAEQEKQKAEAAERERDADIDPLQPYVARMFGVTRNLSQPITVKEATIIREQCINDFKMKQLARQILVQERFDKLNGEYKAKRLWYLANQFILTPEKEAAYFAMSAELAFQVHSLEVRLTRHKDLSGPRFKALEEYLDKHPLMQEYVRMRNYYRTGTSISKSN